MKKPDKLQKSRAFTLLEVMLAVSIISISLLTVINSFSLIVQAKATTSNFTQALFLLEEKLHDLKTGGFKQASKEGIFPAPFERFSWQMDSRINYSEGLRRVLLVISWQERGQVKELQVLTCLKEEG